MTTTTTTTTTTTKQFTVILSDREIEFDNVLLAIEEALRQNSQGNAARVCGPQGWILVHGKLVGTDGADWQVFEVSYDEGRGWAVLRGVNQCTSTLETFSWNHGRRMARDRSSVGPRYSFQNARILDARGMRVLDTHR